MKFKQETVNLDIDSAQVDSTENADLTPSLSMQKSGSVLITFPNLDSIVLRGDPHTDLLIEADQNDLLGYPNSGQGMEDPIEQTE